ncbi:MAG TPA: A24 family peptidase [Candidatus Limnocylindrales bacterium]|jgi:leader peptidase (prepilin peptidase)/N-methyltransferase|nr:A24 family peptidase [Candidatus Limnocylindrales bacterium]
MTPEQLAFAAIGLILGLAADRLATRWPEHDEEHPPGRPIDWRTAVCGVFGAFAFAVLPGRFWGDPLALALFTAWFATLVIGMATDLDQRILSNILTLPVIPVGLVYALSGLNPLVGTELLPAVAVATLIPGAIYLASIPFGEGAFGIGDVKLLAGVGLMSGGIRGFTGFASGLFAAGIVIALLLVTRRVGRKTFIPFGPFLVFGAVWGIFVRA